MIQSDLYDSTGNGDGRFIPTLYRWETRTTKRFFRKPTTETGWFHVVSADGFARKQRQVEFLEDYARQLVSETEPDFDEWLAQGLAAGWVGPAVCSTHDGIPSTEAEDEDDEPCIHILRLYESPEVKAAVEENHPPSNWRKP